MARKKVHVYQKGEAVQWEERVGTLVRRVFTYRQWLVRLSDARLTWWWESDFTPATEG